MVRVNVVLNRTVVVDNDWRFDNLCGCHLQSQIKETKTEFLLYSQLSPCGLPAITDTPANNTDSSLIPSKNILEMFDWNKLPLLRTLANEDTNSRSLATVSSIKGVDRMEIWELVIYTLAVWRCWNAE